MSKFKLNFNYPNKELFWVLKHSYLCKEKINLLIKFGFFVHHLEKSWINKDLIEDLFGLLFDNSCDEYNAIIYLVLCFSELLPEILVIELIHDILKIISSHRLYIPLPFWFSNYNNNISMPLIALQYRETNINVDLISHSELVYKSHT